MNIADVHEALLAALITQMDTEGRQPFIVTQVAWGDSGGVCFADGEDCDAAGSLSVIMSNVVPVEADGGRVVPCQMRTKVLTEVEVMRPWPSVDGELEPRLAYGEEVTTAVSSLSDDLESVWHYLAENRQDPSWLQPPGLGIELQPVELVAPGGVCAGFKVPFVWWMRTTD